MNIRLVIGLAVALAVLLLTVFLLGDSTPPLLSITPDAGEVGATRPLLLELADPGSGLKNLTVVAVQGGIRYPLLSRDYPEGTKQIREELRLEHKDLRDGPLELHMNLSDRSRFRFGAGNRLERTLNLDFDGKPPQLSLLSDRIYINQGGSGLVAFRVDEPLSRAGVSIGELFFPAYEKAGGSYLGLFSWPWHLPPGEAAAQLLVVDSAGNERRQSLPLQVKAKPLPEASINLSQGFLNAKMPEFQSTFPETTDLLQLYLRVNRELRKTNDTQLLELAAKTASQPLWQGSFLRQPRAANREPFGARRSYLYEGAQVDEQIHLGVDLASLAQAPVPAANSGVVVFAGDLGIYGLCVVLDHGLGLQSLYGHLSQMAVQSGESVERGQILGRTGSTGLAGGDHLHFGMMMAGLAVTPVEWWDSSWVGNNIEPRLSAVKPATETGKGEN